MTAFIENTFIDKGTYLISLKGGSVGRYPEDFSPLWDVLFFIIKNHSTFHIKWTSSRAFGYPVWRTLTFISWQRQPKSQQGCCPETRDRAVILCASARLPVNLIWNWITVKIIILFFSIRLWLVSQLRWMTVMCSSSAAQDWAAPTFTVLVFYFEVSQRKYAQSSKKFSLLFQNHHDLYIYIFIKKKTFIEYIYFLFVLILRPPIFNKCMSSFKYVSYKIKQKQDGDV